MNSMKKSVQLAVGALLASAATMPMAQANPFGYTELPGGYQQAEQVKDKKTEPPKEHKCGEGKCGEGKCGDEHRAEMKKAKKAAMKNAPKAAEKADKADKADKAEEHKCGEGKCGEGKCGGA
jgi:uncharacterized low-complexity protein